MDISDSPLLGMLRERMNWLNSRQDTLSENVANSDSPGYLARDLKPLDFEAEMRKATMQATTSMMTTDPHHMSIKSQNDGFSGTDSPDTESNPTGNTVSLEAEMIKVADTQTQYQTAANLYSKALSMMRTAIGGGN